jgi:hypothetical protein
MKPIPLEIANKIVSILNQRGFVIDTDVESFCRDIEFGESLIANKALLRKLGYCGGDLLLWATNFKVAAISYGVHDPERMTYKGMLDYAVFVSNIKLSERENWEKLKKYNVAVKFICPNCHHESTHSYINIKEYFGNRPIQSLHGRCTKCGEKKVEIYKILPET